MEENKGGSSESQDDQITVYLPSHREDPSEVENNVEDSADEEYPILTRDQRVERKRRNRQEEDKRRKTGRARNPAWAEDERELCEKRPKSERRGKKYNAILPALRVVEPLSRRTWRRGEVGKASTKQEVSLRKK